MKTAKNYQIVLLAAWVLFMFMAPKVRAELKIDSVYPRQDLDVTSLTLTSVHPASSIFGEPLNVMLTGTRFDENLSVSMYPDVGNRSTIIGSVDIPGHAGSVTVAGNIVYVISGNSLQIIDVSHPESPSVISSLDISSEGHVLVVSGNVAYVTKYGRLSIIDISDPEKPTHKSSVDIPSCYAEGIAISGTTAYVTDG